VLDPLAMKVLKGDFQPGDLVRVDVGPSEDVLTFTRIAGVAAAPEAMLH
jgi:hypothetical protein